MRDVFLFIMVIVVAFSIRSGCDRSRSQGDVAKDCQAVCGDIGMDHDYAVKSGIFSYTCQCKKRPTPPAIHRRP